VIRPESVFILIAILTLVVPVLLVVVVAIAAVRRSRGAAIGPRTTALVSILVGLSLGLFILVGGSELSITGPFLCSCGGGIARSPAGFLLRPHYPGRSYRPSVSWRWYCA